MSTGLRTTHRPIDQIRAEVNSAIEHTATKANKRAARLTKARLLKAVYLADLARAGRSVEEASKLTKLTVGVVKRYARTFGYKFHNYTPRNPAAIEMTLNLGDEK